jgi:pimeloyl-ACP methyl ester carboxylesterase
LRVATADGHALEVEVHGEGMPVVFCCGLCTTLENWRPQVEPFARAGRRVVLWDYRGQGGSDVPEDPAAYSMSHVLDDLARVLDWGAPDEPAVLVGHSFGGLASLHMALARPERVRALVLADAGPGFADPEAQARWEEKIEKTAAVIEEKGLEALLTGPAAPTLIGLRPELPAARAAARAIAAQRPDGVARFVRALGKPAAPVIDRLSDVPHPTLVLVGERDAPYRGAAELMASRLPYARLQVLADAGHIPNLEQSGAFEAAVLAFLRGLPGDDPRGG